jgi:hypothetical protein
MANAIKTIMRAVGKANNMIVRVEFLEPDGSVKYSADRSFTARQDQEPVTTSHDDLDEFTIT